MKSTSKPSFKPNPGQEPAYALFNDPLLRHICLVGGSRSGKTFFIVRAIMMRALKASNSSHAILRFRGNAARASIWLDTLPKVNRLCFPDHHWIEHRADSFWEASNGSRIWVGGLDDKDRVEKILGQEHATIFLNECSQIGYGSALLARTRLAQNVPGLTQRMYYDLNPVGKTHWTNVVFGLKKDPVEDKPLENPEQYARLFLNPEQNRQNLTEAYLKELRDAPTRHRQRFYEGIYVDEIEGALWTFAQFEELRVEEDELPELLQTIVVIDPSGASTPSRDAADIDVKPKNDEIGIIVASLGADGIVYLRKDLSMLGGPELWGKAAIAAYHHFKADHIVAEVNFGGDMVAYVIRSLDGGVPVKKVRASEGKHIRAEPVSAHYHRKLVRHVGTFPKLEEQLCDFTTLGYNGPKSPDRADACLVAGTIIATDRGPTPIESVTTSDRVMTRNGWQRVAWAGLTRTAAPTYAVCFSDDTVIEATAEHPFLICGRGFVPAAELRCGDRVLTFEQWTNHQKSSCSTDESIADTLGAGAKMRSATISASMSPVLESITGICGSAAGVRSLRDIISTTRTRIHSITRLIISHASRLLSTPGAILMTPGIMPRGNCSIPSGIMPLHGTAPQWASLGILHMPSVRGTIARWASWISHVLTVVQKSIACASMSIAEMVDATVRGNAIVQLPIAKSAIPWRHYAQSAREHFASENGASDQQHVPVYVEQVSASRVAPVYNLHVEDTHEFFANGILVHNCIWAVTDLALEGSGANWVEYYRRLSEEANGAPIKPEFGYEIAPQSDKKYRVRVPDGITHVYLMDGHPIQVPADRIVSVSEEDAAALGRRGWARLD